MISWPSWLAAAWPSLVRGAHVALPPELPHPRAMGWRIPRAAVKVGQVTDWVQSLPDGSRLHVHEFPDGRLVCHRDRWDPSRGALHAVAHVLGETPTGRVAAVAGVARAAWWLLA